MYLNRFIGLLIWVFNITWIAQPAFGQETNPVDQIRFYSTDDIQWEAIFSNPEYSKFYQQANQANTFFKHYFSPWKVDGKEAAERLRSSDKFLKHIDAAERLEKSDCYGGNYRKYSLAFKQSLLENSSKYNFPNRIEFGMSTSTVDLRRLPTREFCLQDIRNAGEGYPFDYFQESSLWIGTPLRIVHHSQDCQWYFVISPYGEGWVEANKVAQLSANQVKHWMNKPWAAILQEGVLLKTKFGQTRLHIGTLLPVINQTSNELELALPFRALNGKLVVVPVKTKSNVSQITPLAFNQTSIKALIEQLLGTKYGWGGIDEGRDCSSTLKDFFTPFGIWLPRNSRAQKEVGKKFLIQGDKSQKLNTIKQKAIPFLTILYKPGHSMLYLGNSKEGLPLIFHNVWGIKPILQNQELKVVAKQRNSLGVFGVNEKEGGISARYIIGRTSITSVDPEAPFPNITFDSFMKNMESGNIIE